MPCFQVEIYRDIITTMSGKYGFSIEKWELTLQLWFGDTLSQARSLFKRGINFDLISSLNNKHWKYIPNFHISHIQKHLIWFNTQEQSKHTYFEYWSSNIDKIRQYSKPELLKFIEELHNLELIDIDDDAKNNINDYIINTNRNHLNICPGFGLTYNYPSDIAVQFDKNNKLIPEIRDRIQEGLGTLQQKIEFLRE